MSEPSENPDIGKKTCGRCKGEVCICSTVFPEPNPALDTQIGGEHYKSLAIQPVEYAQKNGLKACEFLVLKYITRHGTKDGKAGGLKDLNKAKHAIDLLIQMEYSD